MSGKNTGAGGHFDEARLAAWLAGHVEDFRGPLTVERFAGGQSNPTYRLATPGRSYVLRRKPPGRLLKGAHAIEREARVLTALASVGFPVARVYGLCTDESVIGTWFYVMEMVEGRIFWDATFPDVSRADRPRYFDAMNRAIARLHQVNYRAAGLGDYGRAGNYFERQIARWSGQYLEDAEAGRDPNMDRLIAWLPANIPPGDETSIVHGDFRCDNMIFHPTEPEILAVLDWELSTLGDPLADFSYHLMQWHMPHSEAGTGSLTGFDLTALGIPSLQAYVDAYVARTGLDPRPHLPVYFAYNFFRLAAIMQGIAGRVRDGTATSTFAAAKAELVRPLAAKGWQFAREAGP
jgi:aminoglycoside phosphotransferase (APT) family kinase protein